MQATIPTGYRSSKRSAWSAAPSRRALFPPQEPEHADTFWRRAIHWLARHLNPRRQSRANPRVVKRKVLKWAAKREHHTHWPQPRAPAIQTITPTN